MFDINAYPFDTEHNYMEIGGEAMIFHCHHYLTILTRTILDADYIDSVTVHGAAPLSGNKSSNRIRYSWWRNRQTHRHRLFSQCLLTRLADNSVSADT